MITPQDYKLRIIELGCSQVINGNWLSWLTVDFSGFKQKIDDVNVYLVIQNFNLYFG